MQSEMTFERLRDIVEAYGAAPRRWPASERDAALAFIADSAEARDLIADALHLDLMLDTAPMAEPASDMLVSRIMAARPRALPAFVAQKKTSFWKSLITEIWPYGSPAFPAGALAASIVLGVSFGFTVPNAVSAMGLSTAQTATASGDVGEQLVAMALVENNYSEDWQ
ncbi:MAG: hypothetical protein Q7T44_10680 [Parvibaculum sp.]|nr:hypothetical protein [Parvibaculum sp.]